MKKEIEVKCPGSVVERCRYTLRLKVTKKDYEKTVMVTCPKCGVEFRTTIHTPVEVSETDTPKDEDFLRQVDEAREEFNEAQDVFHSLFGKFGKRK